MTRSRPAMNLTRRTFAIGLLPGLACTQDGHFSRSPVFSAGEDGYHTFRIPALLPVGSGVLLAFAEGRRFGRGDSGAIDLVLKRSTDSGATWSALQVVWSDGANTCGNPCPVVDTRTGRILLPMTWNSGEDNGRDLHSGTGSDTRRVFLTYSDDDGRNWSSAREITGQAKRPDWWWYATGPGVAIQVRNGGHAGRIVVPANHSSEKHGYAAHAMLSDDGGENWRMSSVIAPACNESQVVELVDGRLMMNSRNQSFTNEERTGYRAIAFSADGGETWTPPQPDAHLGDPQVQASLTRYSWPGEGNPGRLLFSNPAPPVSRERGQRIRMTVRSSLDDGRTWPVARLIHEGPAAYSSLARLHDGSVGLLYEAGSEGPYEAIQLARFSIGWLDGGAA
ncbi:MAG: exo-alpha-sialidase [Acidobacteriia bacterium]|nr:exo-alpha-sialidase [Terriglobia bacterium]MYG00949.1 exo-alpha-sialidase [Terriglobia bacterium]MYK11430.1 exo-alpha-sialidase [Terriglobia bacterium]